MQRFKNILAVVGHEKDLSQSLSLRRAVEIARDNRSRLHFVSVVEDFPRLTRWLLPSADELLEIIERDRKERLEGFASGVRGEGIEVGTTVLRGKVSTVLVEEVIRGQHDLLIKGAEGGGDRLVASNDWHLLRDCPCPVFLVKPGHERDGFRRILAAVDPTPTPGDFEPSDLADEEERRVRAELNVRIMEIARGLAAREQAELHVLHVWRVPGESLLRGETVVPQKEVDEYVESVRAAAHRAFERFLNQTAPGMESSQCHFQKGDPAEVILGFSRSHDVDVIVMGTVARTGIPGFILGNTAEAVLRRVDCSLLTVKPEGFVSPIQPSREGGA